MANLLRVAMMTLALTLVASPTMAQPPADEAPAAQPTTTQPLVSLVALGAGLVILGAGLGIGRIGGQAVEGMSRQPEAAGSIQTAMIISAALIEGATFFALIVCLIA